MATPCRAQPSADAAPVQVADDTEDPPDVATAPAIAAPPALDTALASAELAAGPHRLYGLMFRSNSSFLKQLCEKEVRCALYLSYCVYRMHSFQPLYVPACVPYVCMCVPLEEGEGGRKSALLLPKAPTCLAQA